MGDLEMTMWRPEREAKSDEVSESRQFLGDFETVPSGSVFVLALNVDTVRDTKLWQSIVRAMGEVCGTPASSCAGRYVRWWVSVEAERR